jgi:hypothetical protein
VLPGGIPVQWIVQGGAVGLLGFVALLIFLGQLIPRRFYRQLERDRDYWRTVALKAVGHTDALLPAAKITTEVTKALSDATSNAVQKALGGEREGPPA